MSRQYVHLSVDTETAMQVGKRHDSEPVILKINAAEAFESGIKFYRDCEVFSVNSVGCGKKINAGVSRKQLTAAVSFLNIKYC